MRQKVQEAQEEEGKACQVEGEAGEEKEEEEEERVLPQDREGHQESGEENREGNPQNVKICRKGGDGPCQGV